MAQANEDYIKELQREVAQAEADKEALKEEFAKVITEEWTDEEIKEKFKELVPTAFTSLKNLMMNAESEAVRANLIKYIFTIALSSFGDKEKQTMSKVLAELMGENA